MDKDPEIVQCNTCQGTYRTMLADGTLYFHACPPDKVTTPATFDKDGKTLLTAEVRTPFANRRDENISHVDADKNPVIKSEGAGVTLVTDAAVRASFGLTTKE